MFKILNSRFYIFILTVGIVISFLVGYLLPKENSNPQTSDTFPFLSKRIFVENQNDLLINFVPLREKLRNMVSTENDDLGVYFEYLPTGTSIGVNDRVEHEFASLVKLPLVMAYYLQSREKGTDFNQSFVIQENEIGKQYGNLWKKGPGAKITAAEAIDLILKESDNTATLVLANKVEPEYMKRVFDNLDITLGKDITGYQSISPKSYSSIFKSLYLSSNLTKDESNQILGKLTESIHKETMRRFIPEEIKIAHKYGEIENQLIWDCGIVYVPQRPYLFCSFSQDSSNNAKAEIAEISKIIYDYVSSVN